jgi:hypothetical protein
MKEGTVKKLRLSEGYWYFVLVVCSSSRSKKSFQFFLVLREGRFTVVAVPSRNDGQAKTTENV